MQQPIILRGVPDDAAYRVAALRKRATTLTAGAFASAGGALTASHSVARSSVFVLNIPNSVSVSRREMDRSSSGTLKQLNATAQCSIGHRARTVASGGIGTYGAISRPMTLSARSASTSVLPLVRASPRGRCCSARRE